MKGMLGLKSKYISVLEEDGSVSFGGNQGWVVKDSEKKHSRNNIIRKFGCGMISGLDIFTYMEGGDTETPLTIDEYREHLHELERRVFHVSYWLGVPGTRLARRMNRLFRKKGSTKDHYVTITGLLEDEEHTYFEISSWGRKYFIDYNEFDSYVRKHDNYIFSNIMWIRRKKG